MYAYLLRFLQVKIIIKPKYTKRKLILRQFDTHVIIR